MAGDWIKMRVDLADDPAVIGIAEQLDIDEDTVVGKLHRLWSWADRQTLNGNAPTVTCKWVDRYLSVSGFASAMQSVGWLQQGEDGITLPSFERHNGKTGKSRALTNRRVAKTRSKCNADRNGDGVTKPLPEKRREEKSKKESKPKKESGGKRFVPPSTDEVSEYCRERKNGLDAQQFVDFYQSKGWMVGSNPMKDWKAAVRTWERNSREQSAAARDKPSAGPKPLTDDQIAEINRIGITAWRAKYEQD